MKLSKKKKIILLYLLHRQNQINRREKWVNDLFLGKEKFGFYKSLLPQLITNPQYCLKKFIRIDKLTLDYIVAKVKPPLEKFSRFRATISVEEKVIITLRFLATGETFESLQFQFLVAANTISGIVKNTCKAIIRILGPIHLRTPSTEEEWTRIAKGFGDRWNHPNCIGCLDGKHVAIKRPPDAGSAYFNYKHFHSIVLMAICDSDYRLLHAEVGCNGAISDGGVFNYSNFKQRLDRAELGLPQFNNPTNDLPFVLIGDGAFKLTSRLMKPYTGRQLTLDQRVYNYRTSRPRNTIENTFGIMAMQWRALLTTLGTNIETTKDLVLAICILHNILVGDRLTNRDYFLNFVDHEDVDRGLVNQGNWRVQTQLTGLQQSKSSNNPSRSANEIRDRFCDYFSGSGKVSFQMNRIHEF